MMADEPQAFSANHHPLLGQLMNQTGMVETIDQMVDAPDSPAILSAGTVVAALVHNILGSVPIRLYQLDRFFADKPLPLLFPWHPDLPLGALNEYRAGRVLDALWNAGPQKVFSAVCQGIIQQYALDISRIHLDSTSKSFYGAFMEQPDEGVPQLKRGHSKDHRPDLVQLLLGIGTTREGVLVSGDVDSGNTNDMRANGYWITQVRNQLGLDAYTFLLYIADSAAVTEENLKLMRLFHLDIISRLPARFGLHETLLNQAPGNLEEWADLGKFGQSKEAATYRAWETEAELAQATYRFVVVWSSSLAVQHRKQLNRRVLAEWTTLEKGLAEVHKQQFEQAEDAQTYWNEFVEQHPLTYHQVTATMESVEVTLPYPRPGRPKKGAVRPTAIRYQLVTTVTCDLEVYRQACRNHGKFVLIASLLDRQAYSARDILGEYKEQHTAERAISLFKDPTWVGSFCLKKPERIAAFAYVLLMATTVYTLLERQVRRELQEPDQEPIRGLNNRPTKRPTAYAVKTILTPIMIVAERVGEEWRFRPSQPLSENQKRILSLAGFGEEIYHWRGRLKIGNYHCSSP